MSNTRTTAPPTTPPAMAPTLIVEAEEVVNVVVPFDVDAAATAEDDDAVDSTEDRDDVVTTEGFVGEVVVI